MTPGIHIRSARANELSDLSALCLRSKAFWGYDPEFMAACADELTLRKSELDTTHIALAEGGDGVLGIAQLIVAGDESELLKLFVEPACMKRGVGRALFLWACETARIEGAHRLCIEADPDAAPFYRRLGAIDAGLAPSGSIHGRMLPRLIYDLTSA